MRFFTIPHTGTITDKQRTSMNASGLGWRAGFFDAKVSPDSDPVDPGDYPRRGSTKPRAGMSTDVGSGKARGPNPL